MILKMNVFNLHEKKKIKLFTFIYLFIYKLDQTTNK